MHDLVAILVPIACGCVLPIMIVWFSIRESMNKTNQRTKIVLAAIEKNPNLDIEELMEKISPKKKLLKEKLLSKLQTGNITTLLGIGFLVCALYADYMGGMNSKDLRMLYLAGIILLVVGGAFLRNYFVGKKMLAKEITLWAKRCLPRRWRRRRNCWYHRQKASDPRSIHHPGRA